MTVGGEGESLYYLTITIVLLEQLMEAQSAPKLRQRLFRHWWEKITENKEGPLTDHCGFEYHLGPLTPSLFQGL